MKLPEPIQAAADRAASMTNKQYQELQENQGDATPVDEAPVEAVSAEAEQVPQLKEIPEPQQQTATDWEKRFKSYKAATDNTIHDLRTRLATLTAELAELAVENEKLKDSAQRSAPVSIPSGVLSEDDLDALGPENAERLAKLVRAAQSEQQKKLDSEIKALHSKLRSQEVAEQANKVKADSQSFWGKVESRLQEHGVDLYEVDNSPEFAEWLEAIDPESGRPRSALGRSARDIRDVKRMVDFYLEFKGGRRKEPSRSDSVVPVGATVSRDNRQSDKRIWTPEEYKEQVMLLSKGGAFTAEKRQKLARLQESYMAALKEGRVRR
jgi:hypothetical protein